MAKLFNTAEETKNMEIALETLRKGDIGLNAA
jgi:hypothetical protein